ncbi:O-methyltransferas-like protein family 3 [Lindgomyces ingoldianus]|uniref:O-methyltransferas-like protein family 3 n=1 Tax=Lindgomyces ingoldianus TaxID=673940 RepID=A0ACB6QA12_9PLEO|nr:O-methyltransferas-like protein family 3 [Lindgomyces ingoldianus]KAF2463418.1 O-methyltransferas-like protein family 3 [Lindgomyces ingoldianus]
MSYLKHETDERWTAVDRYSFSHLHPKSSNPSPEALEYALSNSEEKGLPDIAVSPSQGKFLMLQAKLLKAKNVLEIGTLGGYSTIWMANASPETKVTSVEVDKRRAEVAQENFQKAGVSDRVEVRLGPGMEVLPQVAEEIKQGKRGKFQLVFIDADKQNNWNYVEAALGMCDSGAEIIVDNVVRQGKLALENTEDPGIEGARKVVEMIGKDDRLDGVVLQTVGEKSYDGFLIAVVK